MNVLQILNEKGRDVVTDQADATIREIVSDLASRRIGAIVIVDDGLSVLGIVSERDVMAAIADQGVACLDNPVNTIMTRNVVTCTPSSTVQDLMEEMTTGRFRHMPVVENGQLVGIISIGDVVKNHIAEVEMEASALKTYVAG